MKKFLMILCLIGVFALGSCASTTASARDGYALKIRDEIHSGQYYTMIVTDEDTGVNYIVVSTYTLGNGSRGIAISPRYNADGTLYTS